jgi:hypothetical protein
MRALGKMYTQLHYCTHLSEIDARISKIGEDLREGKKPKAFIYT